jgi:hypothetical protein
MQIVLLVVAILCFLLATLAVSLGPLVPLEVAYLGLACFAASHLPLP